jgi:hypothetical protein
VRLDLDQVGDRADEGPTVAVRVALPRDDKAPTKPLSVTSARGVVCQVLGRRVVGFAVELDRNASGPVAQVDTGDEPAAEVIDLDLRLGPWQTRVEQVETGAALAWGLGQRFDPCDQLAQLTYTSLVHQFGPVCCLSQLVHRDQARVSQCVQGNQCLCASAQSSQVQSGPKWRGEQEAVDADDVFGRQQGCSPADLGSSRGIAARWPDRVDLRELKVGAGR